MTADILIPDVADALDRILALRPPDAGPITIVFATADFSDLLGNWLGFARRAGEAAPVVVALDQGLAEFLRGKGIQAIAHAPPMTAAALWHLRALVFQFLAERGVDFIHSDIDAIWLRDPRPLCFADAELDLVFSQGTTYPGPIWERWGFVLCCGLFAAKASSATADFFAACAPLVARVGDDQVVVNHLLADRGLRWELDGMEPVMLQLGGKNITSWRRVVKGRYAAGGLNIGMLPHRLVPRLPQPAPDAWVRHPLGPGDPTRKASLLRQLGCWTSDL